MEKSYHIKFRYADSLSNYEWRMQECHLYAADANAAEQRCLKLYGLGRGCAYEIISVEEE